MALQLRITKTDVAKRLVYGWASVVTKAGTPVTDLEGDQITVDDLRAAAHEFMAVRTAKALHQGNPTGHIVESIVLDNAVQAALGISLGQEGWFVGVKVTDDATWERVEKGELKAFSIGGTGVREPLEDELVTKLRHDLAALRKQQPAVNEVATSGTARRRKKTKRLARLTYGTPR